MSCGYWLTRGEGLIATQKSPYHFDKMTKSLQRRGTNCHNRQYFIPQYQCTEDFKQKNIPVEEDLDNPVIEQMASNVNFFDQQEDDSLTKQLKQARLQKIKSDTKLINQKLQQRKKLLFAQWSQKFFNQFANHFGKLRNVLVELHMNEEQVAKFNQCLESSLNNLQDNLDNIWNQFKEEKENEN